jgi:hypothetical protein
MSKIRHWLRSMRVSFIQDRLILVYFNHIFIGSEYSLQLFWFQFFAIQLYPCFEWRLCFSQ